MSKNVNAHKYVYVSAFQMKNNSIHGGLLFVTDVFQAQMIDVNFRGEFLSVTDVFQSQIIDVFSRNIQETHATVTHLQTKTLRIFMKGVMERLS